jgi:hypothetical protein
VLPLYSNTGLWGASQRVKGFAPYPANIWQLRGVTVEG